MYPEFTVAFSVLFQINSSTDNIEEVFPVINKYMARLFQLNDEFQDVDSLCLYMFLFKGKSFENMPTGSGALKDHSQGSLPRWTYLG